MCVYYIEIVLNEEGEEGASLRRSALTDKRCLQSTMSTQEFPQKRLQTKEETPIKQGDTMCMIVFDVYYWPVFSESLLEFGDSSREFRHSTLYNGRMGAEMIPIRHIGCMSYCLNVIFTCTA